MIKVERISPLKRIQTAITGVMGRIDGAGYNLPTTQWLELSNGRTPTTTQWSDLDTHYPLPNGGHYPMVDHQAVYVGRG